MALAEGLLQNALWRWAACLSGTGPRGLSAAFRKLGRDACDDLSRLACAPHHHTFPRRQCEVQQDHFCVRILAVTGHLARMVTTGLRWLPALRRKLRIVG